MHARLSRTRLLGFTLLELIVTIVVLGLLAALAVPAFAAVVDRSKDATLEAEVEALGRGVAALAAFDGGGVTDAHVEEFLAAETAASALVSTGRWDLYADAAAPAAPAAGDLLFAVDAGYVGLATAAAHRDGRVVYAVVGTGGTVAQLTDATDADADTAVMRGADALCFYGITSGCTADADAEPVPSTGGASGTTATAPAAVETRVENDDPSIVYSPAWALDTHTALSGGSAYQHVTAGYTADLTFTGTGIRWITFTKSDHGIAEVFIDGVLVETVDTYAAAYEYEAVGYENLNLTSGEHTIRIRVTGTKNASSNAYHVYVDAFDVIG